MEENGRGPAVLVVCSGKLGFYPTSKAGRPAKSRRCATGRPGGTFIVAGPLGDEPNSLIAVHEKDPKSDPLSSVGESDRFGKLEQRLFSITVCASSG